MVERVWALLVAAAIFVVVSTAWTQRSPASVVPLFAQSEPHTATVIGERREKLPARVDDWPEPRVDLNGNEIDDAVIDYRVDGRGELYERHAPDTALLHLSSPEL